MSFSNPSWSTLEYLYYLSTPILAVIGSAGLIGLYQAKKEFKYKVDRESIQRAVELSLYYVKEILPGQAEFDNLFRGSKYETEIKKFDQDEFRNFDLVELQKIVMKNHEGESFDMVMANIKSYLGDKLNQKNEIKDSDGIVISAEGNRFRLDDLMNNLEYFSMNFIAGIADKETVYRALHQSYLATIRNLYFVISFQNDQLKDKFYNNVIELYQEWNSSDCKIKKEFEEKDAAHAEAMRACTPKGRGLKV